MRFSSFLCRTPIQCALLSAALLLGLGHSQAHAATYTVTNINDSGAGSLRQAVTDANAAGTADTIVFSASTFSTAQTISLSTELPSITNSLTISGPTALSSRVTINRTSTATTACLVVTGSSGANLTVTDLTFSGRGGGILYQGVGSFLAQRCVLSGNTQGIVAQGVSNLVEDCTFTGSNNAGLLGNPVTVRRSTFVDNQNSGNTAAGFRGNNSTLENCTFVRNDGGVTQSSQATLTIDSCTFADNDQGVGSFGSITIRNSLIVGSRQTNIGGTVQADSFTTTSGTAAAAGLETSDGMNAVILRDNGGLTQTVLLLAGGTALNTGSTSLSTDQRGVGRPKGGADDRGAFEFDNYPPALASIETTQLNYTPTSPSQISSTIAVSDPDFALPLTGATVSITTGFLASEDRLVFTNQNGITGSYNTSTGVLTLSGSSSIANYQTALRSVQYQIINTQNPNTTDRTVSFQVDDGFDANNLSNTVSRSINILPTNNAPVNNVPGAQNTNEDTPLVFSAANNNALSISDIDAGTGLLTTTLTITNGTFAQNNAATRTLTGTLSQINSNLATTTYVPTANFFGTSTLTMVTNDNGNTGPGGAKSDTNTVSITVRAVNDNPTANDDVATVVEDSGATVINVLSNDSSAPETGETLTVTAVTQPAAGTGTVTLVSGVVRFTPAANFAGTTTFTYTISDGNGGTDTANVTMTVTPVNDPPTATNDTVSIAEDSGATVINVLANDSSAPDTGETLTVTAVTQPTNGTVTLTSGVVRYTPPANYNGTTTFTYTINDGKGATATATVTVTVTPVNDPPTANDDAVTVAEDSGATVIDVKANDSTAPDTGEIPFIATATEPANGTLTLTGGVLRFTPAPNFFGTTTFTYTLLDGNGGSDIATVTVTVTPVNDNPTANNDVVTVAKNSGATVIDVLSNDSIVPDADETLTVTAVTQPINGTVTLTSGVVRYTPPANFNGTTSFTYTISDDNGGTATATVTLNVTSPAATSGAILSEFRFSGPNGALDEFIELANTTSASLDISGWTVTAGSVVITIPSGKTIPPKGHLLITNSGGYSLGAYATFDVSYTGDIDPASTLTLNNAGGLAVDSVGNLSAIAAPSASTNQYAYVRRLDSGVAADSGNDSADFNLVDSSATISTTDASGVGPLTAARLGAPGPQNIASSIARNGSVELAPLAIGTAVQPTTRYVSRGSTIDPKGRMGLRRTLKNNTGATVTTLRFRIVGGTTGTSSTASGVADLRAISSAGVRYYDTDGTTILQATVPVTLDAPSLPTEAPLTATSGNNGKGGGMNSSWTVALPPGGLAPGASVGVEFLFGIVADGNYRIVLDSELLP